MFLHSSNRLGRKPIDAKLKIVYGRLIGKDSGTNSLAISEAVIRYTVALGIGPLVM